MREMNVLVATRDDVLVIDPGTSVVEKAGGLEGLHPTCLAADRSRPGRAWCGTVRAGVRRSDDGGRSWTPCGLEGRHVTALAAGGEAGLVWAGTEPSEVWRSVDGGDDWEPTSDLETLPSSSEWSFPPKPETHHVRWIACHPTDPVRVWIAIEAGALVRTFDGGRTWRDRVPEGPWDTHELALHPERPDTLRVAAGDGYFESDDGGDAWARPRSGLDVGYLRSVAVDPGNPSVVIISASSRARSAYVAGHADGRVYRRESGRRWTRILDPWPDPPTTIAPLLVGGIEAGELWAADERGVFRSGDAARTWARVARFEPAPPNLRGLVLSARG